MEFEPYLRSVLCTVIHCQLQEKFDIILKKLKEIGVEQKEHLKYVNEGDFESLLTKIQARMLVEKFQCGEKTPGCDVSSTETVNVKTIIKENTVTINWGRVSAQTLKKLENKVIITPSERRELVRVLANEILQYSTNPSKKLVRIVAQDCIMKFTVLEDKMENVKLGTGYESLAYQIYTRLENVRRKPVVESVISNDSSCANEAKGKKKRRNTVLDSYGCVQWEPPFPVNETEESLEVKKKLLKQKNEDMKKLLKETYYIQRKDINNGLKILKLTEEYPPLFLDIGMFLHFKLLTNIDILKTLEESISLKGKDIISFLGSCGKKNINFLYGIKEEKNELLCIILGISRYFDEDLSFLITLSPDIDLIDEKNLPRYPLLVGSGSSYFTSDEYVLLIDGIVVNSSIKDTAIAVAMLFVTFFIFNIKYTKEVQLTLEFFQRCLVGINPVSGTKYAKQGTRIYHGVNPKIYQLVNRIKSHNSWLTDIRE